MTKALEGPIVFLLRPHKRHTFNTFPERFITVINILFSNIPPQKDLHVIIPDSQQKTKPVAVLLALEVGGLPDFSVFIKVDITSLDNQLQQIALWETNCFI